jgi:hypothetical protein
MNVNPVSDTSDFEADLHSLQAFRDWLESLVAGQQPLEEWGMSREALQQRWLPQLERGEEQRGRLFF